MMINRQFTQSVNKPEWKVMVLILSNIQQINMLKIIVILIAHKNEYIKSKISSNKKWKDQGLIINLVFHLNH